jgi:plastocyanin
MAAAFAAVLALSNSPAFAQAPAPVTQSQTAQLTAKIVAIDTANRLVTLEDSKGNTQTIQVGPGVTRFSALKVGDTVTFTYQESVAYAISKPGAAPAADSQTVTRTDGSKPGGTITKTVTALVTIQAIDLSVPSVTIKTADGHVVSLLVKNKANLNGVKVGDVVQVTYTQALVITVK